MGASEGRVADLCVPGEACHLQLVHVGAPLPVVQLSHVVVARLAVEPGDALPAEEEVRCRLHDALPRDHALAVLLVLAPSEEPLEHRGLSLLDLEEQRVVVVPTDQEEDVAASADAPHPDHLACRVDVAELLDRVVLVRERLPVGPEQLLDLRIRLAPVCARVAQVLERDDQRRVGSDP